MSKKILSIVLAIVLVMSTFVTVAFAATNYENDEDKSTNKQIWSLTNVQETADGYTVDVKLTTNYPTGVIEFVIVEDDANGVIELTDVTIGAGVPSTYKAELSKNLSKGKVFIVPQTEENVEAVTAVAIDGVVATLTYSYTGSGKATIAIDNDPKTAENPAGTLIAARMGDASIVSEDMIVGQSVVDTNGAAITGDITPTELGKEAAEPADLALTETGSTNGVIIDTNKTFGGVYAGVVYGFPLPATATTYRNTAYLATNLTATNGGTLTYATSTAGGYGTSATITVKNSDGSETGKVYVVVIFGDVNCDGRLNANDTSAIKLAVGDASNAPVNSVKRLAANVFVVNNATQMHTLNANDTTAMKKHVAGTSKFAPANLATIHNRYNNFYQ